MKVKFSEMYSSNKKKIYIYIYINIPILENNKYSHYFDFKQILIYL